MTRYLRRFATALLVATAMCAVTATAAFANLESEPSPPGIYAYSATNPGAGADTWWRQGWGTSLHPELAIPRPGTWDENADGYLLGMAYSVNGLPVSVINTATPDNYYNASFPVGSTMGGTNLNNTIDLLGVYANLALGERPASLPGAQSPLEGQWFMHYVLYSNQRYGGAQRDVAFGIDITPPAAVQGLSVSSGLTQPAYDPNTWYETSRGLVRWTAQQYDALSGVGYYEILVDDKPIIPETDKTPSQGRVYSAPWLPTPSSISVENLPAGRHKLSVVAVDRATNAGPAASVWYQIDPDTPTISWGNNLGATLSNSTTLITVNAADAAGDPDVTFFMDGVQIGEATSTPYAIQPNLSYLTTGPHTLRATATDKFGHTATITRTITWAPGGYVVIPPTNPGAGSLDTSATGTSPTNPDLTFKPQDPQTDRHGWGNTLMPEFDLQMPAIADGFLYNVVTATQTIDPAFPDQYYKAGAVGGTHLAKTVDMTGIMSYPPPTGWRSAPVPGSSNPVEGMWYFQFVYFDRDGHAGTITNVIPFGIDVTPPKAVTGLHVVPTLEPGTFGAVSSSSRAHIIWNVQAYDSLSGVSYYKIYVDGQQVIPADGIVWDMSNSLPNAVTLENLTAGHHTIGVAAVDRATNEGPLVTTDFWSDPDVPTISFTSPSGNMLGVKPTLKVNAQDKGGVQSVAYKLDGSALGTSTASPFSLTVDLSGFGNGTHTLTATATDVFGHTATVTKTITLDKTPLVISGMKTGGSGRKPSASVYVNRAATVKIYIPRFKATKTVTTSGPGRVSFSYTYPKGKKYPSVTSFRDSFTITASDALGNVTSASGRWTVRISKVVKIGSNKVRIYYY